MPRTNDTNKDISIEYLFDEVPMDGRIERRLTGELICTVPTINGDVLVSNWHGVLER